METTSEDDDDISLKSESEEEKRRLRNDRINNLIHGRYDYTRVPLMALDWIIQDQNDQKQKLLSESGVNTNMDENWKHFDWKLLADSLPFDIKFEIIDYIPTFSKRRILDTKLSCRESVHYHVDGEYFVSYIDEMSRVMKRDQKRNEQCLRVMDVPLRTMHKMRIISKEYAKRMKFKLMTLSHLDLPLFLSQKGLCYFASFLKAQQVYLNKDEDHEDVLIYSEMPLIYEEPYESLIEDQGVTTLSGLYDSVSVELGMFEFLDPDENELPHSLVEFVGSNTVITSVKTTGRPNMMELIFSTCKNLRNFISGGKISMHHEFPSLEHWSCQFFTGQEYQLEMEIQSICKFAPNVSRIDMTYSCERQKQFKQDFLENIDIPENMALVLEGCVNKIIPPTSGKKERELKISITHLESSDEKLIVEHIQYYGLPSEDNYYLFDTLFTTKYFTLDQKKSLAYTLFAHQEERFPLEAIRFNQVNTYAQDFDTIFAYVVYLCNEYQNGILFNLLCVDGKETIDKALDFGWKPGKWDELLLLTTEFTVGEIEKILDLIRLEYQDDVTFMKFMRLVVSRTYHAQYIQLKHFEGRSFMKALINYLKKNFSGMVNLMKILFAPTRSFFTKGYLQIVKSDTIMVPFIASFCFDTISFSRLLDFYPEEFWTFQNENGDTLLHITIMRSTSNYENWLLLIDQIIRRQPKLLKVLNNQQRSPTHLAFHTGNVDLIRLISFYDIDLEQEDCTGCTPLDYIEDENLKNYFE